MRDPRRSGWPLGLVIVLLLVLHFYVRPRLYAGPGAPDFLLIALLVLALRTRPGTAAMAGFVAGLVTDVLSPVRIGAGALVTTVVAYLAAWGRAIFFPENLLVNTLVFAAGTLVRNVFLAVAAGGTAGTVLSGLGPASLLQALTTAAFGFLVSLGLRSRTDTRLEA